MRKFGVKYRRMIDTQYAIRVRKKKKATGEFGGGYSRVTSDKTHPFSAFIFSFQLIHFDFTLFLQWKFLAMITISVSAFQLRNLLYTPG